MRLRAVSGLAVLLAAWTIPAVAEQAQPRTVQPVPRAPVTCKTDYIPVCGHDRAGRQQTYNNECLAKAAGAARIYAGTCVSDITQ